MKKIVKLKDVDPILFAGINDVNLKLIEKKFNTKFVLRGNELVLDGDKKELVSVESLINDRHFSIFASMFSLGSTEA